MVELCAICAWEHIGDAEVEMIHAKSPDDPARIIEKAADASMYLRQAEFQADDPDLAKKLRDLRYKVEGPVFGQKYTNIVEVILDVDELRKEAQKRLPQTEEGAAVAHKKAHGKRIHSEAELREALAGERVEEKGATEKYEKTAETLEQEGLPEAAEKIRGIAEQESTHGEILAEVEAEHEAHEDHLGNPGHVPGTAPFAWTECELAHPRVQRKIEACIQKVKTEGKAINPFAVCRASVRCPSK